MVRVMPRRSRDVSYLHDDQALEIDGLRHGPAPWWLRGEGDVGRSDDVASVLTTSERSRIVGYDLIVAAPRLLSVLLALDTLHAPAVVDAHRLAVADVLNYLEQRALVVRDRRDGQDNEVSARWEQVVSFTHGVNRHGEPHLHDHVLVGARPAGSANVLDSRALFAHASTADALYRSSLRAGVARATPYVPWRSFDGVEHVAGLDEGYRVLWGGHFSERGPKRHWTREEMRASWASDLSRFEEHGVVTPPQRTPDLLDEHVFGAAFEGRTAIVRRHVVEAWAHAATFGQSAAQVEASVNALYPDLRDSRGVHEVSVNLRDARMIAMTREHGPRPLEVTALDSWRQRSRERSRDGVGRSR